MKKLTTILFAAYYLVTWREFVANKITPQFYMEGQTSSWCEIGKANKEEKFPALKEAKRFVSEHGFKRDPNKMCFDATTFTTKPNSSHDCYDDRDKDQDALKFDFKIMEVKELK